MSNGEEQGMAVKGERVVLRGVRVIVLDDLKDGDRRAIQELGLEGIVVTEREAWVVEGLAPGSFDAAIEAHAGPSGEGGAAPGRYRAVKKGAWLEKGPRVIEPPIA